MKNVPKISILLLVALFLTSGNVLALGFSSSGYVNANLNNSWDSATSSGTAQFIFTIDEAWPSADRIQIEFENDIFDTSQFSLSDFTVINPSDWTMSLSTGSNGYVFSYSSAGTPATQILNPILININYTLLDAAMYSAAAEAGNPSGWAWDEGQAWALSYTMANTQTFDLSSGSTAAPVPEPASLLLLGTGLIGLAGYTRKRKKVALNKEN